MYIVLNFMGCLLICMCPNQKYCRIMPFPSNYSVRSRFFRRRFSRLVGSTSLLFVHSFQRSRRVKSVTMHPHVMLTTLRNATRVSLLIHPAAGIADFWSDRFVACTIHRRFIPKPTSNTQSRIYLSYLFWQAMASYQASPSAPPRILIL